MKTRNRNRMRSFLGYDPVEKQHKVLEMTSMLGKTVVDHQVLTVRGDGNMRWRLIECDIPAHHLPRPGSVCISGVLYYTASASSFDMIVCFDVRSDKFSFVKLMEREMLPATLINFQGKLAAVRTLMVDYLSDNVTSFEMWSLEDPEKHEWSKRIFNLSPMWKDVVAEGEILYVVGATDTNEFVISLVFPSDPFHVYYYNFVKESITRVDIQGMGAFEKVFRVHIFLNHVEDVKLM